MDINLSSEPGGTLDLIEWEWTITRDTKRARDEIMQQREFWAEQRTRYTRHSDAMFNHPDKAEECDRRVARLYKLELRLK